MKCPDCQDGYLIVKFSENRQYFLGCTNYQNNGKGCNKTLSAKEYYKLMGYDLTELDWLPKKEIKEENTKPQQKTIEYVTGNRKFWIKMRILKIVVKSIRNIKGTACLKLLKQS